jgi:hypothetical protein
MATKKKPEPEAVSEVIKPGPEPSKPPASSDFIKLGAVVILAVIVVAMAWYFISLPPANTFVPGPGVNATAFQSAFLKAGHVYVVMDTRGLNGTATASNILQCGVDFSGSSGMGGKTVTYVSLSDSGCMEATLGSNGSAEGSTTNQTVGSCISQLKNGIVVYVENGANSYYYSNALMVGIGSNYTIGTCGIRRA